VDHFGKEVKSKYQMTTRADYSTVVEQMVVILSKADSRRRKTPSSQLEALQIAGERAAQQPHYAATA
jgi:hypothetical protein